MPASFRRPRLRTTTLLGLTGALAVSGACLVLTPPSAAATTTAGKLRIGPAEAEWCDLEGTQSVDVVLRNQGSKTAWVGLLDQDGGVLTPREFPLRLDPGASHVTAAMRGGVDWLELWSFTDAYDWEPDELVDRVRAPEHLDCSSLDPSATIGDVDPASCGVKAALDNRRSSAPVLFAGNRDLVERIVPAGGSASMAIPLASFGPIPDPGGVSTALVDVSVPDPQRWGEPTQLASAQVQLACDGPVPTLRQVGAQAAVSSDRSVAARLTLPSKLACGGPQDRRLSAGVRTVTDDYRVREAYVTYECVGDEPAAQAVVGYSGSGGEIDYRDVELGDEVTLAVDDDGPVLRNVTQGWTLWLHDDDPAPATGAGLFEHSNSWCCGRPPSFGDVRIGGARLSTVDDLRLHWSVDYPSMDVLARARVGKADSLRITRVAPRS